VLGVLGGGLLVRLAGLLLVCSGLCCGIRCLGITLSTRCFGMGYVSRVFLVVRWRCCAEHCLVDFLPGG